MRNDQGALGDTPAGEQQDVDVDDAWSPAPRPGSAAFSLDLLGGPEQLSRRALPLTFYDLVQESRLVQDAPGLGFDDAALARDADSLLAQTPARGAQVARAGAEVRAQAEIDLRQLAILPTLTLPGEWGGKVIPCGRRRGPRGPSGGRRAHGRCLLRAGSRRRRWPRSPRADRSPEGRAACR